MKQGRIILCVGLLLGGIQNVHTSEHSSSAKILLFMGLAITGFFIYKKIKIDKEAGKLIQQNNNEQVQEIVNTQKLEDNKETEFLAPTDMINIQQNVEIITENAAEVTPLITVKQDNVFIKFLKYFKNLMRTH